VQRYTSIANELGKKISGEREICQETSKMQNRALSKNAFRLLHFYFFYAI